MIAKWVHGEATLSNVRGHVPMEKNLTTQEHSRGPHMLVMMGKETSEKCPRGGELSQLHFVLWLESHSYDAWWLFHEGPWKKWAEK